MLSGKTQKSIKILPEVLFLRDFGVYLFKSSTGQQYKPKSVIRPKQACYKRICLSFSLFSAFVSSSCRRPRFAIAR